jgi:hypothetical protein
LFRPRDINEAWKESCTAFQRLAVEDPKPAAHRARRRARSLMPNADTETAGLSRGGIGDHNRGPNQNDPSSVIKPDRIGLAIKRKDRRSMRHHRLMFFGGLVPNLTMQFLHSLAGQTET